MNLTDMRARMQRLAKLAQGLAKRLPFGRSATPPCYTSIDSNTWKAFRTPFRAWKRLGSRWPKWFRTRKRSQGIGPRIDLRCGV